MKRCRSSPPSKHLSLHLVRAFLQYKTHTQPLSPSDSLIMEVRVPIRLQTSSPRTSIYLESYLALCSQKSKINPGLHDPLQACMLAHMRTPARYRHTQAPTVINTELEKYAQLLSPSGRLLLVCRTQSCLISTAPDNLLTEN